MPKVFCRNCRQFFHDSASSCPHCGAPRKNGGGASSHDAENIPDDVKGWSWGAFLMDWIWAIGNRTWIGLLALIPGVSIIVSFILGFKGGEWAWKNKHWESVEHFNRVQRLWTTWGIVFICAKFLLFVPMLGIILAIAIPAYQDYTARVQINEAVAMSNTAMIAVSEYRNTKGYCPANNADAGAPEATKITGKFVAKVEISGCKIVATMKTTGVVAGIAGQTLEMTPDMRNGVLEWRCSSSAADKFLPARCRR
jgi:Tfp pilus assembly major pilin PilA